MRQAAAATMSDQCECYAGGNAEDFIRWKVGAHKAGQQRRSSSGVSGVQQLLGLGERVFPDFFESAFLSDGRNQTSNAVRVVLCASLDKGTMRHFVLPLYAENLNVLAFSCMVSTHG